MPKMNSGHPRPSSARIEPGEDWSWAESRELIELYLQRMDVRMMARYFNKTAFQVITELAWVILGEKYLEQDETQPRYQKRWSLRDHEILTQQYQVGARVPEIANVLRRDELAVAYRIIEKLYPPIPKESLKKVHLEHFAQELQAKEFNPNEPEPPKICPVCKDVVIYCTCPYEDDRVF